MKYKCLILDHDDTIVDSSRTVHYPCFLEFMKDYRPNYKISYEDYMRYNSDPGTIKFFSDIVGLNQEEIKEEEIFWEDYASKHHSLAFNGLKDVLNKYKESGGKIVVVSYSLKDNILKDYKINGLPTPDYIFDWSIPKNKRKPSPFCVEETLKMFNLKNSEVLVVDDLKPGIEMAINAKVDSFGATWSIQIKEHVEYMLSNATYTSSLIEDFKRVINQ